MNVLRWLIVGAIGLKLTAAAGEITRPATSFDRCFLTNEAKLAEVKAAGNLAGADGEKPGARAVGWFEYDFSVEQPGWYELLVQPTAANHELLLDGDYAYIRQTGPQAGNYWLTAGRHTLRVQRLHWSGLGMITGFTLRPAGTPISQRLRVTAATRLLRRGEELRLNVQTGGLERPVMLHGRLVRSGTQPGETAAAPAGAEAEDFQLELPAGAEVQNLAWRLPCAQEGNFRLELSADGQALPAADLPPVEVLVLDTAPQPRTGREPEKQLLTEIDCAERAPDYQGGGETRVITKPFGRYRESGTTGWLHHMNSEEPSWYAYRAAVPEAGRQYLVELDYPDDQLRTFCFAVREGGADRTAFAYPTAGGADCGHEFSLSGRMQTQSLLHWAQTTDLRILVIAPQDGLRAAASRIRIYALSAGLPALDTPAAGGRAFGNWYEEGASFLGVYGAPDGSLAGAAVAADRWARSLAYMGGDTLFYTMAIYQFGLYPTAYNRNFGGPYSDDQVGAILLRCEKYGQRFLGEFHPEARELDWPDLECPAGANRAVSAGGGRRVMSTEPIYSPLHPRNRAWYLGLIGEFVDRYKSSPAMAGVSLRLASWCNPGLNNFHSLEWGYDDYTVELFGRETGQLPPVDSADPQRAAKRAAWLLANAREEWIAWRCRKITELHRQIVDRVRAARSDLKVYLHGDFDDLRGAGIDVAALTRVDGLMLIGGAAYGRRLAPLDQNQRNRDRLLEPASLNAMRAPGQGGAFTFGAGYFEATEVVVPPPALGFPASVKARWMSGVVNPAGRHYLERWAVALAETDAGYLGDGGNAYTLGQPLLREFLRQYRALPNAPFTPRADARDPVAVWERRYASDYLFYLVNRARYPVKVRLKFAGPGEVRGLAGGETLPAGEAVLDLNAYELRAFAAPGPQNLTEIKIDVPADAVRLVTEQVAGLEALAADVAAGRAGETLRPAQTQALTAAAAEARRELDQGHYWRARTLPERSELLAIYAACRRYPPQLRDDGAPLCPEGALSARKLQSVLTDPAAGRLAASETLDPDWGGEELLASAGEELRFKLTLPVDARYRIELGQLSGGDWGMAEVTVAGQSLAKLAVEEGTARARKELLAAAPLLPAGEVEFRLRAAPGKKLALSYLWLEPLLLDVVSDRWQVVGPFALAEGQDARQAGRTFAASFATPIYDPERKRDFAAESAGPDGRKLRWQIPTGQSDYVNLKNCFQQAAGSLGYAVTYIHSPQARHARLVYGMDYWAKFWLNGDVVKDYAAHGGAPFKGQFTFDVNLRPGWNELLLKVVSGSLGNGFWLAVSDPGDLKISPRPE